MRWQLLYVRKAVRLYNTIATDAPVVSIRTAQDVSIRSSAIISLPSQVVEALEQTAADSNRKAIRLKGQKLTDDLKSRVRTKHRGGIHPNFSDQKSSTGQSLYRFLRGKRRQSEHRALNELVQSAPITHIDDTQDIPESFWNNFEDQTLTQALSTIADEARESVRASSAADGALYRDDTASAYAVMRFPACYAALHRVLNELRMVSPAEWVPSSILDFGAGPGTATWAAHAVWSSIPSVPDTRAIRVTAVEPSVAMATLGQEIQRRFEETQPATASAPIIMDVRWMSRLSSWRTSHESNTKRKYDVVIAGYVLSEIPTASERRQLIKDLWSRTGKYLVIVEPGTPAGFDLIQNVRSQILEKNPKLSTEKGGHVVAPCPHDGRCPLVGTPSWCHFIQRFERPATQRRAKAMVGRLPPRNHQDERYSYVIMAKGPRNDKNERYMQVSGVHERGLHGQQQQTPFKGEFIDRKMAEEEKEEDTDESSATGTDDIHHRGNGNDAVMYDESTIRQIILENLQRHQGGHVTEIPQEIEELLQITLAEQKKKSEKPRESVSAGSNKHSKHHPGSIWMDTHGDQDGDQDNNVVKFKHLASSNEQGGDQESRVAPRRPSVPWSRLIRPPRKRSGHVVLDVCSAYDDQGEWLGGNHGVVLRQVVSKRKSERETADAGPYKLARKMMWGDVWPTNYQNKFAAFEPPSIAPTQGDDPTFSSVDDSSDID